MLAWGGEMAVTRKGRPLRPRPDDFSPAFVILGRVACEEYYRTWAECIDRWLGEAGRINLRTARANYVRARKSMMGREHQQAPRQVKVTSLDAHRSARTVRETFPHVHVAPAFEQCWEVGEIVISSAEMKALAEAVSPLSDGKDIGQGGAR